MADGYGRRAQSAAGKRSPLRSRASRPLSRKLSANPYRTCWSCLHRQKQGTDIAPELSELHLTQSAFKRLLRVWALVENSTVTDTDWDDVYHILVQARKQQNYAVWREEETQKQIALTPRQFKISETGPQLPPWRGTWRARLNWLDTLQARIDQLRTTEDALRADVSAVEEQTLPLLRDALISALASQRGRSAAEEADWLVNRLLVDLKTNASQRTTRLIQAIETVQGRSLRAPRRATRRRPSGCLVEVAGAGAGRGKSGKTL